MNKRLFLGLLLSSSTIFIANPAYAISSFIWNGSATYDCIQGSSACTLTATNFSLNYDGTNWSNNSSTNGSLTLTSATPAGDLTFLNQSSNLFGVYPVPNPVGNNSASSFTISENSALGRYVTFYLDNPVNTGQASQEVSIYAVAFPSSYTGSNNTQPNNPQSLLSVAIFGVSAPGPLSLFGLIPFFTLSRKFKSLRSSSPKCPATIS